MKTDVRAISKVGDVIGVLQHDDEDFCLSVISHDEAGSSVIKIVDLDDLKNLKSFITDAIFKIEAAWGLETPEETIQTINGVEKRPGKCGPLTEEEILRLEECACLSRLKELTE